MAIHSARYGRFQTSSSPDHDWVRSRNPQQVNIVALHTRQTTAAVMVILSETRVVRRREGHSCAGERCKTSRGNGGSEMRAEVPMSRAPSGGAYLNYHKNQYIYLVYLVYIILAVAALEPTTRRGTRVALNPITASKLRRRSSSGRFIVNWRNNIRINPPDTTRRSINRTINTT